MLEDAYRKHLKEKGMEVVFISSDRDAVEFKEYFKTMPWLAVEPFKDSNLKALFEDFNLCSEKLISIRNSVRGIPSLILLDRATGDILSRDGRFLVMNDPSGKWLDEMIAERYGASAVTTTTNTIASPSTITNSSTNANSNPNASSNMTNKSNSVLGDNTPNALEQGNKLSALLGDSFMKVNKSRNNTINKDGKLSNNDRIVALYFSAHWCGPCRRFTPQLVETYNNLKSENHDVEIIFISSDSDEASFKNYFQEMPWLALPFDKRDEKAELSRYFEVSGIPTLVVLSGDFTRVLSSDAPVGQFADIVRNASKK